MSDSAENFFASAPQNFAVEDNWSLFKTTLIKAMVNYIPQRGSSVQLKFPWITPEIKCQMRKKDHLHMKALCYQNPDHGWRLRNNGISFQGLSKNLVVITWTMLSGEAFWRTPQKFWSFIRSCKSEDVVIPPLRYGNTLCTSDKSKAEALNSFFYSVFTQEKLPIPTKPTSPYNQIPDIDISAHGVHKQFLQ